MTAAFDACEICGADLAVAYAGPVRAGRFGKLVEGAVVGRCAGCGVERLDEASNVDAAVYEGVDYRRMLGEADDAAGFFAAHDATQPRNLAFLRAEDLDLRGRVVADVGCGAGSFLDHVAGLAARCIAVEPCAAYHPSLLERGYTVHPYAGAAAAAAPACADVVTAFAVIEHVPDPRGLLADMARLCKPGGAVVVSTPNRRDVLMGLLPDAYPAFFYRAVHRWYFDVASLSRCAALAGLETVAVRAVHRFGLSNALRWLRDRAPGGDRPLDGVDSAELDALWARHLEAAGTADYLFGVFRPAP